MCDNWACVCTYVRTSCEFVQAVCFFILYIRTYVLRVLSRYGELRVKSTHAFNIMRVACDIRTYLLVLVRVQQRMCRTFASAEVFALTRFWLASTYELEFVFMSGERVVASVQGSSGLSDRDALL